MYGRENLTLEYKRTWIEEKNMRVFSLWHPDLAVFEVDLFVEEPFDFDEVWERRVELDLDRTRVTVIGLQDLVDLKRAVARPRDLEDVKALLALAGDETDE